MRHCPYRAVYPSPIGNGIAGHASSCASLAIADPPVREIARSNQMSRGARLIVVALAGLALAGCGSSPASPDAAVTSAPTVAATATPTPSPSPTPAPTATPTVPPTPEPTAAPTASPSAAAAQTPKLSVKLPKNWQPLPVTEAALNDYARAMAKSSPLFASVVQQVVSSGQYKQISVFALRFKGAVPTGDAVGMAAPNGGLGLDGLMPMMVAELKQVGATNIRTSQVTLPIGRAVQIDLNLKIAGKTLTDRAWFVVRGPWMADLTVTCFSDVTACLKDGTAVAKTMKLVGG
jgi:hypothetical protein